MIGKNTQLGVNAARGLVIDSVNKAKSGHPGMALDVAPALYLLFRNHLNADPSHPNWLNRDRFVLSAGHCSALLYSILHLAGYDVTLEDLKSFRQLGSRTPGHPEVGMTPGVDATAGPLGQGIAQAVGMALAERHLSALYPDASSLIDHYTYVLLGDGCLEEGISQEAISFAGLHKLEKLVMVYDANLSTLDGPTSNSMNENVKLRFESAHWHVIEVQDGNDLVAIDEAYEEAKAHKGSPTLIIVHSIIGYGTELEGNAKSHGNPLGTELGQKAKRFFNCLEGDFEVPTAAYEDLGGSLKERGAKAYALWEERLSSYKAKNPSAYAELENGLRRDVKQAVASVLSHPFSENDATRNVSGKLLEKVASSILYTFGGSADVAGSVKTAISGDPGFGVETPSAKNINYGIREFAMAAIQNGILLHGGLLTYVGSFLVFSDYMKNAIRMAAIEKLPAIYLFSHDSIAVGEDGPTHQPIEQLAALRSIPNTVTFRPGDAREMAAGYVAALTSKETPTSLILSRQNLPLMETSSVEEALKGAYFLRKAVKPSYQLIASGSEASLALEVAKRLSEKGLELDVISMPSMELFEKMGEEYKKGVLRLPHEKRISIEMLSTFGWGKYALTNIGIDTFGESAPFNDVLSHFGFTIEKMTETIERIVSR